MQQRVRRVALVYPAQCVVCSVDEGRSLSVTSLNLGECDELLTFFAYVVFPTRRTLMQSPLVSKSIYAIEPESSVRTPLAAHYCSQPVATGM